MGKITTKQKVVSKTIHSLYCDKCGKHLGDSEEYDDGYYEKYGEYDYSYRVDDEWFRFQSYLCDECKQQFVDTLKSKLIDMGFKLE